MSLKRYCFCPIIGKRVEMTPDQSGKKKVSFEPGKANSICQSGNEICCGNCSACKLM